MKKTLLSAAAFAVVAVSAVSIAPTTSEAIPAFARQTGAACLSCHFQTFPALNDFGRAFKLGAFTDVGEQALIEDDNFSLPAVLNLGMVLRPSYKNVKTAAGSTTTYLLPRDNNLLVAGRVGSNTGAFVEFAGGAGNFQMMNSFDFDTFKAGLNIAATSFGPTAALEFSSVYGQHSGKLFGGDVSAINATLAGVGSSSIAGWISNDTFTLQIAAVVPGANVSEVNTTVNNPSFVPMLALTYAGDLGGFDTVIEVGTMNGTQVAAAVQSGVKANWIAAQVQGEIGDASLGIYADFVTTKANISNAAATAVAGGKTNLYSALGGKKDGYSIRAEIEPIHQLLFGVGYGTTKDKAAIGKQQNKHSLTHYAATYEIYQNMEFTVSRTDDKLTATTALGVATGSTTKTTRVELEAVF